jgi:hypothetical protein
MIYDSAKNEIAVVVTDFDYNEVRESIADSIKDMYQSGFETDTCGVYAHGRSSCDEPTYTSCPNSRYDHEATGSPYCVASRVRQLSLRRENYNFLPSVLEYYWQNGIGERAIEFLQKSRYVTSYKSVAQFHLPRALPDCLGTGISQRTDIWMLQTRTGKQYTPSRLLKDGTLLNAVIVYRWRPLQRLCCCGCNWG